MPSPSTSTRTQPTTSARVQLWCAASNRSRRGRRDRGVSSIEVAVLFPLVLVLTFGAIQVAYWYQARSVCQAAAQAGARAARVYDAPAGAGVSAGTSYIAATGGGMLTGPALTQAPSGMEKVTVTCTGQASSILPVPGLSLEVRQSSTTALERFTTP